MTKNQQLIKQAIESLQKVDKTTIEYKNTFEHILRELISFDTEAPKQEKPMTGLKYKENLKLNRDGKNRPPKTACCNSVMKYKEIKGDGANDITNHSMIIYCSHCLELMDGNGFKLITSKEQIA